MTLTKQIYYDAHKLNQEIPREKHVIVWTNGCFDLLHAGHLYSLQEASKLGDLLIVGLNTDDSVRQLKGDGRPIISEHDRAALLSSLQVVDAVLMFNGTDPLRELSIIKPDIYAKGSDYDLTQLQEAQAVTAYGGQLVALSIKESISTTNIIKRIQSL